MGDATIGIKVADGSFYPVLEGGFTGRKRLVLTTARDNQVRVQIDLFRGNGEGLAAAGYIGSLIIENIPPAPQGDPEIELFIGVDDAGQLSAEASDMGTGESQRFATSLTMRPEDGPSEEGEFVLEDGSAAEEQSFGPDQYAAAEEQVKEEERRARRPGTILVILIILLGAALLVAAGWFIYRQLQPSGDAAAPAQPAAPAVQPATAAATDAPAAAPAESKPAETKPASVSYRVRRGDTLWDLAATYYRNPWLYPKIARANKIKNPDLIIAGTRIIIPSD